MTTSFLMDVVPNHSGSNCTKAMARTTTTHHETAASQHLQLQEQQDNHILELMTKGLTGYIESVTGY
ncbi:hypothetical protein RIF29_25083 [Crotalaria pallida]|uniref:Uncharacterized protein n=1 Tax=Crotalaria pallida TaxID=3830 RepID=A0AAN9EN49_CROPI